MLQGPTVLGIACLTQCSPGAHLTRCCLLTLHSEPSHGFIPDVHTGRGSARNSISVSFWHCSDYIDGVSPSLQAEQQKLLNEAAHTLMDFTRVEDDAAAALLALCELDESAQSPVHESKSPSSPLQPASAQFPVHGSRSPLAPLHSSAAEDSGDASLTPVDLTSRADSAAAAPPHVTGVSVSPASGGKPANDTGTNAAYRSDNKAASIKQKAHLHRDSNDQDFSARQMPNPQSDCSTSTHLLLPAAKPAKLSVGTGAPTAKPQSSALMRACALLDAPVKIGDPVRSAGISHHDQSQHANATRIAYEMQLRNAEQNSRHVPSLDFPAGVRPFRTDKEREDYVTPFTKPLTDTHQQIGPALLDMMKQPAWQAKQKERQHPHTSVSGRICLSVSFHAMPAAKV